MRIVWDEPKRLANIAKHGLDFASVEGGFDGAVRVGPTRPSRTGRPRFKVAGFLAGRSVVAIFSPLGAEAVAILSLRPARPDEKV